MTDKNEHSPPNSQPSRRRSSFAGQAFADIFSRGRPSASGPSESPPNQGPIVSAAAEASRRRLSLSTTLGLSSSPIQTSPFSATRGRGDSMSSSNGGASIDESAVEDETPVSASPNQPQGPFARRASFGARALRDMKGNGGGGTGPNGEGFNWAENIRSRAERGSISGPSSSPTSATMRHPRAKSVALMDHPVRDSPKPVNVPDQFQERILKGDFYMD